MIEIDLQRASVVDFSEPVQMSTFEALVHQRSDVTPEIMAFMEPFSLGLWIAVLLAIILCSLTLWAISRLLNWSQSENCCACACACSNGKENSVGLDSEFFSMLRGRRGCERFSYAQCVWYTTSCFFKHDSGNEPRSFSSKLLSLVIAIFTVILVACYTANLAAFLAIEWVSKNYRTSFTVIFLIFLKTCYSFFISKFNNRILNRAEKIPQNYTRNNDDFWSNKIFL